MVIVEIDLISNRSLSTVILEIKASIINQILEIKGFRLLYNAIHFLPATWYLSKYRPVNFTDQLIVGHNFFFYIISFSNLENSSVTIRRILKARHQFSDDQKPDNNFHFDRERLHSARKILNSIGKKKPTADLRNQHPGDCEILNQHHGLRINTMAFELTPSIFQRSSSDRRRLWMAGSARGGVSSIESLRLFCPFPRFAAPLLPAITTRLAPWFAAGCCLITAFWFPKGCCTTYGFLVTFPWSSAAVRTTLTFPCSSAARAGFWTIVSPFVGSFSPIFKFSWNGWNSLFVSYGFAISSGFLSASLLGPHQVTGSNLFLLEIWKLRIWIQETLYKNYTRIQLQTEKFCPPTTLQIEKFYPPFFISVWSSLAAWWPSRLSNTKPIQNLIGSKVDHLLTSWAFSANILISRKTSPIRSLRDWPIFVDR